MVRHIPGATTAERTNNDNHYYCLPATGTTDASFVDDPTFRGHVSWNDVQLAAGPVTFHGWYRAHWQRHVAPTGDAWDAIEQFRAADLPELVNQRTREDCH